MRLSSVRRAGSSLERAYVDVNVLYYYLTAHPEYGERAKEHLEVYGGLLVTSSLTVWLLHVLTKLEGLSTILEELGVELAPLDAGIVREAERLERPRDFEDRLHLATARRLGVRVILSNDRDFDGIPGITRVF